MKQIQHEPGSLPPFLYGSHYSTAAVVLYFMIRLEPFTSEAIDLQDGHFDHSARMFWFRKNFEYNL